MSDRYPGGIITKTPVTPAGPYAEGSAPGVWTLEQQAYWQAQGLWPNASNPTPNDPYFQYVTSLLHGDGTNGGQNNTFLDSSTNAFTITRNGNTTQGSFSPYGSNWGNYFNGSSTESVASNTALSFGTGDFTVECWFYRTVSNDTGTVQVMFADGSDAAGLVAALYDSGSGSKLYCYFVGAGGYFNSVSPVIQNNTWYHFAWTRSGSTMTAYLNGIALGTASSSDDHSSTTGGVVIGRSAGGTTMNYWQGYISNVRLVKGQVVYSSNFTPSTTPLTAVTGTSLLTCQSNRFVDNSTNAFTVTANGTPQVTRFSPFAPTYATQYSTSTIGGSGYFDNSGDYLSVANNTALQLGSSDFTIDFWWYPNELDNDHRPLQGFVNSGSTRTYLFLYAGLDKLKFYASSDGSSWDIASARNCGTPIKNQWNFVRAIRSGSTWTFYMNGTETDTFTSSSSIYNGSEATEIGGTSISNQSVQGYLTDVRIIKGTALSNSIPTSPLTAVTNTSLLLNYTNGAIYDNAETLDWETVGNAQISTSVVKYGTGSLAFDGSGDRLVSQTNNQLVNFGTGNFTIEAWIYPTTLNFYHSIINNDAGTSSGTRGFSFSVNSSNGLSFFYSTNGSAEASIDSPNSIISTNTWYHVAVSKVGTATKIFLNGTQVASGTISAINFASAYPTMIGDNPQTTTPFYGYIDDLRVTKGYARYWENFTPPAAAFPNFGGAAVVPTQDPQFNYTTLLLPGNGTNGAQNNTFLDSSANAFTITRNGNTTQGTFTPFSQTGWGNNFDGSTGYLTTSLGSNGQFTGDFTVEFWCYSTAASGVDSRVPFGQQYSIGSSLQVYIYSNGQIETYAGTSVNSSTGVFQKNIWNHIAVVRSGSTVTVYLNGTSVASATNSGTIGTTDDYGIGARGNGAYFFDGYVSNVRVVNGTAVYTSNFTPSTTPLTNITNTKLLTSQSNRFIDNSSVANTITIAGGTPSVQAFSPFAPTAAYSASVVGGSGYFDGTDDYLDLPSNSAFAFGTGDFTVEMWLYHTANGTQRIIGNYVSSGNTEYDIEFSSNGKIYFGSYSTYTLTSTGVPLNSWTHIAWVRSSGVETFYINGVSAGTATRSIDFSSTNGPRIGGSKDLTTNLYQGYISNTRIVKGTAVYTSTFTPPTAPTTAITNTQLLANYTNAGITDATAKNDLETVGNAQISTTQSKFGGSSIYLDGTGDGLTLPVGSLYDFGTGDFTIETWFNLSAKVAGQAPICQVPDTGAGSWRLSTQDFSGNDKLQLVARAGSWSTVLDVATTWNTGTWYHIAIARYNGTVYGFINGSLVGTGTFSTQFGSATKQLCVGINQLDGVYFNGYVQDTRVTNGYARYVQNFTPPTQADQLY